MSGTIKYLEYDFELNIQISDGLGVGLDEFAAGVDSISHQHVERPVGLGRVVDCDE